MPGVSWDREGAEWQTRPAPRVCGSLVGALSLLWLPWGPWGKQRCGRPSAGTFGVEQEPSGAQLSKPLWMEEPQWSGAPGPGIGALGEWPPHAYSRRESFGSSGVGRGRCLSLGGV